MSWKSAIVIEGLPARIAVIAIGLWALFLAITGMTFGLGAPAEGARPKLPWVARIVFLIAAGCLCWLGLRKV